RHRTRPDQLAHAFSADLSGIASAIRAEAAPVLQPRVVLPLAARKERRSGGEASARSSRGCRAPHDRIASTRRTPGRPSRATPLPNRALSVRSGSRPSASPHGELTAPGGGRFNAGRMSSSRQTLPLSTKLLYGLGSVAFGVKDTGFGFFLLLYYNQVAGLPQSWVGLGIMAALFCDAISDPIVGYASDH